MKKKTESTNQESTERTIPVKTDPTLRVALLWQQRNQSKANLDLKEQVLEEMFQRGLQDDILTHAQLCRLSGISYNKFLEWQKELPHWKPQFEALKVYYADRAYIGAANRKLDKEVVSGAQGDYEHPEMKAAYRKARDEQQRRQEELIAYREKAKVEAIKTLTPEDMKIFSNPSPITSSNDGSV